MNIKTAISALAAITITTASAKAQIHVATPARGGSNDYSEFEAVYPNGKIGLSAQEVEQRMNAKFLGELPDHRWLFVQIGIPKMLNIVAYPTTAEIDAAKVQLSKRQ